MNVSSAGSRTSSAASSTPATSPTACHARRAGGRGRAAAPGARAFVVAQVLEVGPHPDPKATKVRLTKVDDGTGAPLTVVCGAPNVTAGKRYPFARLGTPHARRQGLHHRGAPDPRRRERRDALLRARARPGRGARWDPRARDRRRAGHAAPRGDAAGRRRGWSWTSGPTGPTCSATRASRGSSPHPTGRRSGLPQIPGAERLDVPSARHSRRQPTWWAASGSPSRIRSPVPAFTQR